MTILIYIIIVIALLVPLTFFLALLIKSVSFLIETFSKFKMFISCLKELHKNEKFDGAKK